MSKDVHIRTHTYTHRYTQHFLLKTHIVYFLNDSSKNGKLSKSGSLHPSANKVTKLSNFVGAVDF